MEASDFKVDHGKCGICDEYSPGLKMPTHLFSEGEVDEKFVRVPMSQKCCDHMDAVLALRGDLKPSMANGLGQVLPRHFQCYCRFQTSMTEAELCMVWSKNA